jgi:hypothetical protein
MIKPTVGRVVWYWTAQMIKNQQQPYAAIITFVHSDKLINIAYFDADGRAGSNTSVLLLQDGEEKPDYGRPYCEWMPYQKAVASGEISPTLHATSGGESK